MTVRTLTNIWGDKQKMIQEQKQGISTIIQQYAAGTYDAKQTAQEISHLTGGLRGLNYKNNKTFTVEDTNNRYSINIHGFGKKIMKKITHELIPMMHLMIKETGGRVEAHINKGLSTKHYKKGYNNMLNQVALAYNMN